ncbi:MAG: permease [Gemmataceae bacterium]
MESIVRDFILLFVSILWEAMPFIVLGAVIAGIMEEFMPQEWLPRFLPRNVLLSTMIGAVLGLLFPMCECGIIVVMRRLLRKGLPLSCCVAYMLGGPIINFVVLYSTYKAFAPYPPEQMGEYWMVGMRAGLGFVVATVTGLVVAVQDRKYGAALLNPIVTAGINKPETESTAPKQKGNILRRLGNISETALHDFVDITVFLILGALLASGTRQLMIYNPQVEGFIRERPIVSNGMMMVLAVLLNLCSEADAFVAANLGGPAMPASAKLAFLVLGPMLDIKLYLMYTRVFRQRLIWTIIPCVVLQVFVYTLIVYFVWNHYFPPGAVTAP